MDSDAPASLRIYPNATDDDMGGRLIPVLEEISAALGLVEPPAVQMGSIVEFWGVTPKQLREAVAGIETDWSGIIYFPPSAH